MFMISCKVNTVFISHPVPFGPTDMFDNIKHQANYYLRVDLQGEQ